MSQTNKHANKAPPKESEELFTTQDLVAEVAVATDSVPAHNEGVSEDIFNTDDNENEAAANDLLEAEMDIEAGDFAEDEDLDEEPAEENLNQTNEEEFMEDLEPIEEHPDADKAVETEVKKARKTTNHNRIAELPLARVKHIIKLDPEVNLVNAEAVYLITKATESFIRSLAKESFGIAAQQKKKTIAKSHVDQALQMLPMEL